MFVIIDNKPSVGMQLISEAFPPGKAPPTSSKVHEQLAQHLKNHPFPQPYIRRHEVSDLQQLKLLQREWFPLNYSDQFYVKIMEGLSHCYVAEVVLTPDPKEKSIRVVVGAIVFQISPETDHVVDGWINRMFSLNQNSVYIMTLGVIDEMRSKGLARRLLDELFAFTAAQPKIQLITLHVVAYNKRAIHFYKKNGFCLLEKIDDHYHIMGQEHCGLKLGYYVNGGRKREGWLPWFKRLVMRKQTVQEWPE